MPELVVMSRTTSATWATPEKLAMLTGSRSSGEVAQALKNSTGVLFAEPTIEPVDVIAEKSPI